jgi:uncharacterized membrane protein YgcG
MSQSLSGCSTQLLYPRTCVFVLRNLSQVANCLQTINGGCTYLDNIRDQLTASAQYNIAYTMCFPTTTTAATTVNGGGNNGGGGSGSGDSSTTVSGGGSGSSGGSGGSGGSGATTRGTDKATDGGKSPFL